MRTTAEASRLTYTEQHEDRVSELEHAAWVNSLKQRLTAGPNRAAVLAYAEACADHAPTPGRAVPAYIDAAQEAHEAARLQLQATLVSEAVGTDAWGDLLYSPEEVLADYARALDLGCGVANLRPSTLEDLAEMRKVPNARIRRVIARRRAAGEELGSMIARALDVVAGDRPDVRHAYRMVGMEPVPARPGYQPTLRLFLDYESAVALSDALDLSYHETGV